MTSLNRNRQTILFIATNPKDTARLQLEQELRDISEGLHRLQHHEQFRMEQRLAVRPRDIQRAILDIEPQIIHFSGDGMGDQGLLFVDEVGNAKPIAGEALAALFSLFSDHVRCVVLNGCYSLIQGQAIAQHIPGVIGIHQAMGNKAATEFAVSFYESVGSGRSIELAYKLGCSALQLEGIASHLLPILVTGSSEQITTPAVPEPAPHPAAPGNTFNIAGSTITNLTGSGAIHHQETVIKPQEQMPDTIDFQASLSTPSPIPSTMPISKPTAASKAVNRQIEVFFSYSHRDEDLRDEMAKHLSILKRQGVITEWYDRDIGAGTEWAQEIDTHLNSAQVILLLISPDFIASDYCFDLEMGRAMERHEAGEACVIPVILRPVDWSGAPFGKLQAFPKNAKPVTTWANRDEAFTNVAQGIRKAVERMAAR